MVDRFWVVCNELRQVDDVNAPMSRVVYEHQYDALASELAALKLKAAEHRDGRLAALEQVAALA